MADLTIAFEAIVITFMVTLAYIVIRKPKQKTKAPAPATTTPAPATTTPEAPKVTPPPIKTGIDPAMAEFMNRLGVPIQPTPGDQLERLAAQFEALDKIIPGAKVDALKVAEMLRGLTDNGKAQAR